MLYLFFLLHLNGLFHIVRVWFIERKPKDKERREAWNTREGLDWNPGPHAHEEEHNKVFALTSWATFQPHAVFSTIACSHAMFYVLRNPPKNQYAGKPRLMHKTWRCWFGWPRLCFISQCTQQWTMKISHLIAKRIVKVPLHQNSCFVCGFMFFEV